MDVSMHVSRRRPVNVRVKVYADFPTLEIASVDLDLSDEELAEFSLFADRETLVRIRDTIDAYLALDNENHLRQ